MTHGRRHGIPRHASLGANSCTLVHVAGELDMDTAAQLELYLRQVIARDGPRVLLDLAGLAFCDCAGLRMVVAVQHHVRQVHGWVRLCAVPPMLAKLLHILGVDATFDCYPSAPAALAVLDVTAERRWRCPQARIDGERGRVAADGHRVRGVAAQRGKNPGQDSASGPGGFRRAVRGLAPELAD